MSTKLPAVSVIMPVLNEVRHLCDTYEAQRARDLLKGGAPPADSVRDRSKLLLAGFAAGGSAAVRAIAVAEYDGPPGLPGPGTVRPPREAGVILRGEG